MEYSQYDIYNSWPLCLETFFWILQEHACVVFSLFGFAHQHVYSDIAETIFKPCVVSWPENNLVIGPVSWFASYRAWNDAKSSLVPRNLINNNDILHVFFWKKKGHTPTIMAHLRPATGLQLSRVTRSKPQDTWPGALQGSVDQHFFLTNIFIHWTLPKNSWGRIRIPFLTDSFSAVGGRFFWTTHVFVVFLTNPMYFQSVFT